MPATPDGLAADAGAAEAGGQHAVKPERQAGSAFDLWLQRGLHQLYDEVAREPLPEALLRLIEADRKK